MAWHSTAQHGTAEHNTAQRVTAEHNTAQHIFLPKTSYCANLTAAVVCMPPSICALLLLCLILNVHGMRWAGVKQLGRVQSTKVTLGLQRSTCQRHGRPAPSYSSFVLTAWDAAQQS